MNVVRKTYYLKDIEMAIILTKIKLLNLLHIFNCFTSWLHSLVLS